MRAVEAGEELTIGYDRGYDVLRDYPVDPASEWFEIEGSVD